MMRQELFTCVVGDVMDKVHLVQQFLPPHFILYDKMSWSRTRVTKCFPDTDGDT